MKDKSDSFKALFIREFMEKRNNDIKQDIKISYDELILVQNIRPFDEDDSYRCKFIWSYNSIAKVRWNYIIGILSVFSCSIIPLKEAFHPRWADTTTYLVLDIMVYSLYFVDIGITFNTTFVPEDGEEVFDRKRISHNYLSGYFCIDLLQAMPYEYLNLVINPELIINRENIWIEIIHFLPIIRMIRVNRL